MLFKTVKLYLGVWLGADVINKFLSIIANLC